MIVIRDREESHTKRDRKDWVLLLWKGKKRLSARNEHEAMPGIQMEDKESMCYKALDGAVRC